MRFLLIVSTFWLKGLIFQPFKTFQPFSPCLQFT